MSDPPRRALTLDLAARSAASRMAPRSDRKSVGGLDNPRLPLLYGGSI